MMMMNVVEDIHKLLEDLEKKDSILISEALNRAISINVIIRDKNFGDFINNEIRGYNIHDYFINDYNNIYPEYRYIETIINFKFKNTISGESDIRTDLPYEVSWGFRKIRPIKCILVEYSIQKIEEKLDETKEGEPIKEPFTSGFFINAKQYFLTTYPWLENKVLDEAWWSIDRADYFSILTNVKEKLIKNLKDIEMNLEDQVS